MAAQGTTSFPITVVSKCWSLKMPIVCSIDERLGELYAQEGEMTLAT